MSFGVMNAPKAFMDQMHSIFQLYLDWFMVVFLDDILIYSPTKEAHHEYLREASSTLWEHRIFAKFFKCEFWLREVKLLRHIVSKSGEFANPSKMDSVTK